MLFKNFYLNTAIILLAAYLAGAFSSAFIAPQQATSFFVFSSGSGKAVRGGFYLVSLQHLYIQ
jgi:hypothetical protein